MATVGDYSYTAMGFFLTVLGTVLAAVKTVVTNRIQVGKLKLHPLDLLLRMSPLAFVQTVIFSWMKGELDEVVSWCKTEISYKLVLALTVNGIIAFLLNYVSFTANKKTSALTMTVAGKSPKYTLTMLFNYTYKQLAYMLKIVCVTSQCKAGIVHCHRCGRVQHQNRVPEWFGYPYDPPWWRLLQVTNDVALVLCLRALCILLSASLTKPMSCHDSYVDLREKALRMKPAGPALPQLSSNGPILSEKETEELMNIRVSKQ